MLGAAENDSSFSRRSGAPGRWRGVLPQLVVAAGIFASSPTALAQDADAEAARAQALFEEGLALADRGRWPAAEDELRDALELQPDDDRARYQLARTLTELGQVTEAARHLRAIVHSGAPDPIIREAATELLVETEPRIAQLIVVLDGAVDGTTLLIDERPVDPDGAEEGIAVDPGLHVISVTDPSGGPLARRRVDVEQGGTAHLELDVAPTPQAAAQTLAVADQDPAPLQATEAEPITSRWWFWTGVGAVVVGAVVTTVALSLGGDDPTEGDAPPVRVGGGNGMGALTER